MSTNALRKESRPSDPLRRAPAGLWAVAFSSLLALSGCDSKGSGATPSGAGGSGMTGLGGAGGSSGGTGMGGMMMGNMGNMGNMGMGGVPMGGSSGNAGQGGDPGTTIPPVMESGTTTAKFCNPVFDINGGSIEFVLEMGTAAVRFSAASGKCSPMTGATCSTIPAGTIPFRVSYQNQTYIEGRALIEANKPILIVTTVDMTTGDLQVEKRAFPATTACETFNIDGITDGGVPMPTPDAAVPTKK
jgi:hypothetical protein